MMTRPWVRGIGFVTLLLVLAVMLWFGVAASKSHDTDLGKVESFPNAVSVMLLNIQHARSERSVQTFVVRYTQDHRSHTLRGGYIGRFAQQQDASNALTRQMQESYGANAQHAIFVAVWVMPGGEEQALSAIGGKPLASPNII